MDISPQQIRTAEFSAARKGLDPDEVRDFLERVAVELERAQNQSTAMEARARAAVARLQELSEGAAAQAPTVEPVEAPAVEPAAEPAPAQVTASPDEAETISRTLLLAQRTADTTVAEAEAEAARIRAEADAEATSTVESAREATSRLLDEARDEARRAGESERMQVEGEVNSLKARREFLASDVEHLEVFLADQRSRLREAASALVDITERVPGGLAEVRAPLLSASDDDTPGGIDVPYAAEPTVADDDGDPTLPAADSDMGDDDTGEHETAPPEGGLFLQTDIADDLDR